jgi:hypothetical protein
MFRFHCCKTYIAIALLTGALIVQGGIPRASRLGQNEHPTTG